MKVRYWGVRGSIPVPGQATARAGGNTPCVSVELADGSLVVLDGGTGLRNLGKELMRRPAFASGTGRATLLFTHRHWDHIQGLPFFEPSYVAGNRFEVFGADHGVTGSILDDNVVSMQHTAFNFPVPFEQVRRAYRFLAASAGEAFERGAARVLPVRMNHAGVTLGYVLTEEVTGARLAYLCDTAPWHDALLGEGMAEEGPIEEVGRRYRESLVEAARGADLVIHDTFFDEVGYRTRVSWGHSTPAQALDFCQAAGAKRLHLFHYNPDVDDAGVVRLETDARALAGSLHVSAATEGLELTLP